MKRGEIRWYTFAPPNKRRSVLLLTREDVIDRLNEIIVVPVTRTIRGISTEVLLSTSDGMPTECALNFDHIGVVHRSRLATVLAILDIARWPEIEAALLNACGFARRSAR